MNDDQRAVRLLQTWFESEAPGRAPAGLLDRIDTATRSVRPRPGWIARLEGEHVDVIEGGRRAGVPRFALLLATIGLILVAIWAVAFVGSRQAIVEPPNSSQPAVISSDSPEPAASPSPKFVSPMRSIQPGGPVPDELIGTWYAYEFNEYAYYLRSGDPYCTSHWKTTQDCLVWFAFNDFARNANIVTMVDGHLRFWSIGDDRCKDQASLVDYERVGDVVHLTVLPDQCFTDMSDLRVVVPAGSAPTLPPF